MKILFLFFLLAVIPLGSSLLRVAEKNCRVVSPNVKAKPGEYDAMIADYQNRQREGLERISAANASLGRVNANLSAELSPDRHGLRYGDIVSANTSAFNSAHLSEPLTSYAFGVSDKSDLDQLLRAVAPEVPAARRFEYNTFPTLEAFLGGDGVNDIRPPNKDFSIVDTPTIGIVDSHLDNRGLSVLIDLDRETRPNWREYHTERLMNRCKRSRALRAIALLTAGATNGNVTWSTAAGKDPDQDVDDALLTSSQAAGVRPNIALYGDTAFALRRKAHRAQNTAGGFSSAGLTPAELAATLQIDSVEVCKSRYSDGYSLSNVLGSLVLLYTAVGQSAEDASNIKAFVGETDAGGAWAVYEQQVSAKIYKITVEHYDQVVLTSTLGIRSLTVAAS